MKDLTEPQIVDFVLDAITARRKELGLSIVKLADRSRIHYSTISLLEHKKRNPSFLVILKLCKALDLSLLDLLKKGEK
ncbi:MAG: helix-turn-helix transcriptional regulator [Proteobacteria bacterium]|nr:helix-turn-helix transcriptional regulator [Pseudomonadota bacterium]